MAHWAYCCLAHHLVVVPTGWPVVIVVVALVNLAPVLLHPAPWDSTAASWVFFAS